MPDTISQLARGNPIFRAPVDAYTSNPRLLRRD